MEPLVSVILPTHGRPKLLKRAIESVIAQEYVNWELIVIEDNRKESKERIETIELLQEYRSNEKIKLILNEENIGAVKSRNKGILSARGRLIAFLDDDDYFLSNKLLEQVRFMIINECSLSLSHGYIEGGRVGKDRRILRAVGGDLKSFILHGNAYTPMILVERSALMQVGLFTDTPRFQDHVLMIKLLELGLIAMVLDQPLFVHFRHNQDRITKSSKSVDAFKIKHEMELRTDLKFTPSQRNYLRTRQNRELFSANAQVSSIFKLVSLYSTYSRGIGYRERIKLLRIVASIIKSRFLLLINIK